MVSFEHLILKLKNIRMRIFFLLLATLVFSQKTVSTFMEPKKKISFLEYVNTPNFNYLLTYDKTERKEVYYWKVFDAKNVDTKQTIPLLVNGDTFENYFPKDAAFLIKKSDTPIKTVSFLHQKKGVFSFYSGKLDTNNLDSGFYDVSKKYDIDFETPIRNLRLFVHDSHFITLGLQTKRHYTYYKFTEEKSDIQRLFVTNDQKFIDSKLTFFEGSQVDNVVSSKFFPDGRGIYFTEDALVFISPKNSNYNKGFMTKNPINIIYFDLNNHKTTLKEIKISKGKGMDYALVDDKMYVACQSKIGVIVYAYDFKTQELTTINNITSKDNYTFNYATYYLDSSRNKSEPTSVKNWEDDMGSTLILDVDKLDDGNLEFTISGAKYRDPEGFAKAFGSIMIGGITGGITGIGVIPSFGYNNLQPLITSTGFVYDVTTQEVHPIENGITEDSVDKFIKNNGYFSNKTLEGALSEDILIFKKKSTDLYILIDFSKESNLPIPKN